MVILVAIEDEEKEISRRIVTVGDDLARTYGDELVVLHVIPDEVADEQMDTYPDYYLDDVRSDAKSAAASVVQEAVGGTSDVSVVTQVGDPAGTILEESQRQDARYIVIGGRKRTPTGKALFGSVTQSVLLSADRPVVTVMDSN